jgi:myo-inositol-1(or 4)-monophosphatase
VSRDLAALLSAHPLLPLAWRTAGMAARFLADERPTDLVIEAKSSPTDAVSEMDRAAERMIAEQVGRERPDDGFLGEEGGERVGTTGVRWIVDPLDGTVNYLFGLPLWGVSIGVEETLDDGRAVTVGVVVLPMLREAFVGVRGGGAWSVRGGRAMPVRVSAAQRLDQALIATGFGYDAEARRIHGAAVGRLVGEVRDIRRSGSAVVDFSWVARGRIDAYVEDGLNAWDYAAGALIAAEAGAVVRGLLDDDLGRSVVAAAPGIADALVAAVLRSRGAPA